jgi:hypothetical protein
MMRNYKTTHFNFGMLLQQAKSIESSQDEIVTVVEMGLAEFKSDNR